MNDNELDDLFRSNADYLADQPPRDFDKDAFWQHLQTAIPPKAKRQEKTHVWRWAAAVLLAGLFGGIGWLNSGEKGLKDQKLAQKTQQNIPALKNTKQVARVPQPITQPVPSQTSHTGVEKRALRMREKSVQQVPLRSPLLDPEPLTVAIGEYSPPEPVVEVAGPLPEISTATVPEKPPYRVVHINEIRERKQQEAKARTRVAFRIGLPSNTRMTTQSDQEAPLSIPIQN